MTLNRENIDKFAYKASMKEINENEFNLNIPRYVDTFEEEAPVDLKAVSDDIKGIDAEIAEASNELKGFLDELKLDFPGVL